MYKVHPEYFSKKNVYNLEHGYSIVNDKTFRTYFPEYDVKGLRGNNWIHHHVGVGQQAVAVPSGIHQEVEEYTIMKKNLVYGTMELIKLGNEEEYNERDN